MNLFSKERKDTAFHIMPKKDQQFKRKLTFDISKFQFQNGLEQKTSKCVFFFLNTNRSVGAKPQKRCANIMADSETFKQYRDLTPELVGNEIEMVA